MTLKQNYHVSYVAQKNRPPPLLMQCLNRFQDIKMAQIYHFWMLKAFKPKFLLTVEVYTDLDTFLLLLHGIMDICK